MIKLVHKFFPRIGILLVLPLLALSVLMLHAQEATAEPAPLEAVTAEATENPVATELPTEVPVITEVPTEIPAATEEVTEAPATAEPTSEEPETGIAPEPPFSLLVRELLDNGDLSPWTVGAGWSLVASDAGQALQVLNNAEALELLKGSFYNVAVQASFLSDTGTALLSIRNSVAGNYSLSLSPDGIVELSRGGVSLASTTVSASAPGQWRVLRISAVEGVIRASIDEVEVLVYEDSASLPPGTVRIATDFANPEAANSLLLDNFFLWVPADELANYPAPTAYAPPATVVTEAPAATEIAPTAVVNEGIKDYSPFPPPSLEQSSSAQLMSTLGNDNYADAVETLFVPFIVSDNTIGDTTEIGEPSSGCGVGMSNTIWFKYTPSLNGNFRFSTAGSNFDTILAVYTGASLGTLFQMRCNDDISATDLDSQFNLDLVAGTTYYIQLGGYNGRYGNYSFTLQLLGLAAPTVPTLSSPANAARTNDTTPTLSWTTALNVFQYEVQWATNATFTANFGSALISEILTHYTFPDPLPNSAGQIYYWRVRSINGSGVASAFSAVRNFTVDTTAPAAPTLLSPANNGVTTDLTPTLTWSAVTGATSYVVDVSFSPSFPGIFTSSFPVTSASFTPVDLTQQGTYYWRVRAIDAAGNTGGVSSSRSLSIKLITTPANNTVIFTNSASASPQLRWAAVPGVTLYTIQIATDPDFNTLILNTDVNATSYTPVLGLGVYYWQAFPASMDQETPVYNRLTISPPALAAPTLDTPTNAFKTNDTSPEVSWIAVGSAAQYEVQWATNATFTANAVSATVSDPTTSAILPTLPNTAGQIYYWRVRSINSLGVPGAYSAARTFTLDTTAPAVPNLVAPAENAVTSDSTPTLTWSAVPGAVLYLVDFDENIAFDDIVTFDAGTSTSYTFPASLAQSSRYWRVRALDAAGNESATAVRSFVIKILTAPVDNAVIFTSGVDATPVFQWAAVAGADNYRLLVDDNADFSSPVFDENVGNVTAYSGTAFLTGVYYWQVEPNNVTQWDEIYNKLTISPTALVAPSLISPLNAARTNDITPEVSWNTVDAAAQYEVQWATNSTFTANMQTSLVSDPTTTLNLPPLPPATGTTYYWRVRSINSLGVAGAYSAARNFILDTTPPLPATLTAPANMAVTTSSRPTFTWQAVAGAMFYFIDIDTDNNFGTIEQSYPLGSTSFTWPVNLVQGSYNWRVRAQDAAGNMSVSAFHGFTVKILSAPANNAVITSAGTASPVLRWAAVPGASQYTVEIDNDSDFSSPMSLPGGGITSTTSFTAPALAAGVYHWQVKPTGFEQSTVVSSIFTISPGVLAAPSLISPANAAKTNNTQPDLSWNEVTNAYQYEVQLATNSTFTVGLVSTLVNAPTLTTSTLPLAPTPARTYYWRVRTINQFGVAGPFSAARNFVLDTVAPNVPVLVSPANGSTTTTNPVQFRWNASTGAFRYELRYGTTNPPTIVISNLATTTYTSPSPLLMQSYYWQVRAVDAAGNASDWTDLREVKINSGTTAAPIPNRYTTLSPTLFWTPISWTSSGGYYQVQVDNNNTMASPEFTNNNVSSGSPSVTTTGLSEGSWYWRVRACNSSNACGAWSTIGIFTIALE